MCVCVCVCVRVCECFMGRVSKMMRYRTQTSMQQPSTLTDAERKHVSIKLHVFFK